MRITNRMMTNNMLVNINRNQNALNNFDIQIATGKKIQKPSDDPIIAVRALRFRTTVSEVRQYKVNCEDAISWSSVSEQAATNVIEICKRVRDLSVQSASDLLNMGNRRKIVSEFKELKEQFLNEVNTSYAGRYIFSGYKTSTAATFTEQDIKDLTIANNAKVKYEIRQSFDKEDINKKKVVYYTDSSTPPDPDSARLKDVNILRLGYGKIDLQMDTATPPAPTNFSLGVAKTVVKAQSTDVNAYTTDIGEVKVLEDTGEIIINDADMPDFVGGVDIRYEKSEFQKLDLKPECYFDCTKMTPNVPVTSPLTYTNEEFSGKQGDMQYQISYSQMLTVNTPANDIVPVDLQRDIEEIIREVEMIKDDGSLSDKLNADIIAKKFSNLLGKADKHIDKLLDTRADIGGRVNRLQLTINRLEDDNLNFTEIMSKNEDIDYAKTYTNMSSMLSIYKASLQATSSVIKPSLLDFLR